MVRKKQKPKEQKHIPKRYDEFKDEASYWAKILKELCLDLEIGYPEYKLNKAQWLALLEDIIIGFVCMIQDDKENGLIPDEWGNFS